MKKLSPGQVIASNLRRLMESRVDLSTQMKLSKRSGVGQSTVGRILRDDASPSIDTLEDLAAPFGYQARDLLNPELFAQDGTLKHLSERDGMSEEERELLDVFRRLSRSGRLSVMASAHREQEENRVKTQGIRGGGQKKAF